MGRVYNRIPPPPGAKILGWDPKNPNNLRVAGAGEPAPDERYADPYDDVDELLGGPPLDWNDVPPELDEVGIEVWRAHAAKFAAAPGVYREADRELWMDYCDCCSHLRRASDQMRREGLLVAGRSSPDASRGVKNPVAQLYRDLQAMKSKLARQLGLDPTSQRRLRRVNPLPPRPSLGDYNPFMPRL